MSVHRWLRLFCAVVFALLVCASTTTAAAGAHAYDVTRDSSQVSGLGSILATSISDHLGGTTAPSDWWSANDLAVPTPLVTTGVATNSADDVAGLADEAFGAGDAMASRYLKAVSDSPVDIPQGWAPRVADNGKGVVFQRPGVTGNADMIRVMDPTPQYPTGYIRIHNSSGQPVDLAGKTGPASATHIPR